MDYFLFDTNFFVFLREEHELEICRVIKEVSSKLGQKILVPSSILTECCDLHANPAFVSTCFQVFDVTRMDWNSNAWCNLRSPGGPTDDADWDLIALAYLITKKELPALPMPEGGFVAVVTDDMGIVSQLKKAPYLQLPIRSLPPYNFFRHLWEYAGQSGNFPAPVVTKIRSLGEKSVKKFVFYRVDAPHRTDVHPYLLEIMGLSENPFLRISTGLVADNKLSKGESEEIQRLIQDPSLPVPEKFRKAAPLFTTLRAIRGSSSLAGFLENYLSYLALKKQVPKTPAPPVSIPAPVLENLFLAEILGKVKLFIVELMRDGFFWQTSVLLNQILPIIPAEDDWDYQNFLALLWFVENALNHEETATRIVNHLRTLCESLDEDKIHPLAGFAIVLEEVIQTLDPSSCAMADLFQFGEDFYAIGAVVALNVFKAILQSPDTSPSAAHYKELAAKRLILIARSRPELSELLNYPALPKFVDPRDLEDLTAKPLDARYKVTEAADVRAYDIFAKATYFPLQVASFSSKDLVIAWHDSLKSRVGVEVPKSAKFPRAGINSFQVSSGHFRSKLMQTELKEWGIRFILEFGEDAVFEFNRQNLKFLKV